MSNTRQKPKDKTDYRLLILTIGYHEKHSSIYVCIEFGSHKI